MLVMEPHKQKRDICRMARLLSLTLNGRARTDAVSDNVLLLDYLREIVGLTGFDEVYIGETLTDSEDHAPLQFVDIDPATIRMRILVNDSPFAGREGKFVTARHVRDARRPREPRRQALRIRVERAPRVGREPTGDLRRFVGAVTA